MDEQTKEPPWAPSLDEWHALTNGTDLADAEKRAIEAQDFQQGRAYRYLASGGTVDSGGFE
jgi:hypothetical protein